MKNLYFLLCAGLFSRTTVFAQAYVTESDKGKVPQPAVAVRLPVNTDGVENALKAYLAQKGFSPSRTNGFIVYRGASLGATDTSGEDLYFSTSTPDRKMSDQTVLTLIPAKKNQDIRQGAFVDSSKLDAARVFLDSLSPYITAYGINVQVNGQQDALLKAQKKMDHERNDSTDYETRIRDLQADLAQNKADQVKAVADLQTYIGAADDTKAKYQKRLNKLIDRQSTLEKKIRNTQSDLAGQKSDMVKQQTLIDQLQQALVATKARQN